MRGWAFVLAVSCTLGHNHHSPSDSLVSMIGFSEMVSLVYVVIVVITELSVHALSSWTQQSLGFFRVLPSVACWLFPLLSIWSVDVSSSVRRCLLFLVLNDLKCLDLCRYSCSSYWSYLLCTKRICHHWMSSEPSSKENKWLYRSCVDIVIECCLDKADNLYDVGQLSICLCQWHQI